MDDNEIDDAVVALLDNEEFQDNLHLSVTLPAGMEKDAHRNMAREMLTSLVDKLLDGLYAEIVVR